MLPTLKHLRKRRVLCDLKAFQCRATTASPKLGLLAPVATSERKEWKKARHRRSSMALTSARAQSGAKRPCAGVSPCAHVMRPARVALWWHACYSRACARCLFRDVTSTGERHFPPLSLARISRAGGSSPSLCLPDADVFIIFVSFVVIFCSRSRAPPRWNGAEASVAASRRLWRVPFSRLILCASFEQSFTARACERLPD